MATEFSHSLDRSQLEPEFGDVRLEVSGRQAQGWGRRLSHHPGRRHRSDVPQALGVTEEAEHETVAWSRGTGCEETRPALAPQRLAELLVQRPSRPPGSRNREAHPLQSIER